MAWNEVKPKQDEAWDFEESPELVGTYLNSRENVGPNESMMYTLRTDDGDEVPVWGSTRLDMCMKQVEFGTKIRIVFEGMQKNEKTKRTFKAFKVYESDEHVAKPGEGSVQDPSEGPPIEALYN